MSTLFGSVRPAFGKLLVLAIVLGAVGRPAFAQVVDHSKMDHSKMPMPAETKKPPAKKKPATKPKTTKPAAPVPAAKSAKAVDHAALGHGASTEEKPVDHAAMGHGVPPPAPVDHAAMGHAPTEASLADHAAMDHGKTSAPTEPRQPIPEPTQADRLAAFPVVHAHAAHDRAIHSFWLLDRLESWNADDGAAVGWEGVGWVGGDINRLWIRSEGAALDGSPDDADIELLYGRSVSPWWDLVAGVRHDFGDGPSQTFAAVGLMGLSPYKFEIDATAYIGQSGQTALRLEGEYETLLTNRLILKWQAGLEVFGKDDPLRGVGSGLSTVEAGLRLRYEVTRRFAPYIGVVWERAYGDTAELRRSEFGDVTDTRVVAGVRLWF